MDPTLNTEKITEPLNRRDNSAEALDDALRAPKGVLVGLVAGAVLWAILYVIYVVTL